ncbi:MAG: hypothetical protein JJE09_03895 [Bacteroidia bacterium]|nr:hypothetical protein [Bacteroidia bacterium]
MGRYFVIILALSVLLKVGSAQSIQQNKAARILSFRVEAENPGIDDRVLIEPLAAALIRVFRYTSVAMTPGANVEWRNENPLNKFKELTKKELTQVSIDTGELLLKIEIEHRYNDVLGGIIRKSKRHVMRLRIALFTNTGERVWYHKKKDSCCIDFGVSEEDIPANEQMDSESFFGLYDSVLKKTLGKL